MLDAETARRLLDYDLVTGNLIWRHRDLSMFSDRPPYRPAAANCSAWNKRCAGKMAGLVNPSLGYRQVTILGRVYRAHRVVWLIQTGSWPVGEIDHIDLCRTNNAWTNLREANRSQNNFNKAVQRISTTKLKGAFPSSVNRLNPFVARIKVAGRSIHLGFFRTAEEAHAAYCRAATIHHGQFARTA